MFLLLYIYVIISCPLSIVLLCVYVLFFLYVLFVCRYSIGKRSSLGEHSMDY